MAGNGSGEGAEASETWARLLAITSMSLREFLLSSGQSTEYPDRNADHHAPKDDLDDQDEEARGNPNEREEENQQHFPQQDGNHPRGGYAENGL